MQSGRRSSHSGLSDLSRDSADVAAHYDNWAEDYDETLGEWRYEAPQRVASLLRAALPPESRILDAGCGTGLSGRALSAAGFTRIDGIDVSRRSLETAEASGVYASLRAVDMQRLPLPVADGRYDGLASVGVLTYLPDSAGTLREFGRVVRPGGAIVVTHRSDLFAERDFGSVLDALSSEGRIEGVRVSEPQPYLPGNEEFADEILVHYIAFTVS